MVSISILILVAVWLSVQQVECIYKVSDLKYAVFQEDFLPSLRSLETQDLDWNGFQNDYTKAPRHYNTSRCIDNLLQITNNLQNRDEQSMMLLDAWGDIPSGIFAGSTHDFGAYDECLDVKIEAKSTIKAQYCLMDFKYMSAAVSVGICIPDSCSPQLFESILNKITNRNESTYRIPNKTCQLKDDFFQITGTDKIAIAVFTAVLGLVVASTIYDGVCISRKREANKTLLSFSVYNNCKKWLSCRQPTTNTGDIIECMNGIRVLSRLWNLVYHTFYRFQMTNFNLTVQFNSFIQSNRFDHFDVLNMLILAAPFSVDTFFLLSGTLTSITILKQLKRSNGHLNLPALYLHRILRLIPLLAFTILFLISLFRFCGSGPLWYKTASYRTNCEANWWTTLLHIQNYANTDRMGHTICIPQSWYLGADFQLFLMAPFFVYLLRRYEWKMIPITLVLIVANIIALLLSWPMDSADPAAKNVFNIQLRSATHLRYAPYLMGIFLGFIILKLRGKEVVIPKIWNAIGWSMSVIVMFLTIFGNFPFLDAAFYTEPIHFALYLSFGRVMWTLAISFIIFACHHGYGGPLNMILSLSFWQPLSKLTYAIYITHNFVIFMTMATTRSPLHFSGDSMFYWSVCNYGVSVLVALVFFLLFESPIYALEPHILGICLRPKKDQKIKSTTS